MIYSTNSGLGGDPGTRRTGGWRIAPGDVDDYNRRERKRKRKAALEPVGFIPRDHYQEAKKKQKEQLETFRRTGVPPHEQEDAEREASKRTEVWWSGPRRTRGEGRGYGRKRGSRQAHRELERSVDRDHAELQRRDQTRGRELRKLAKEAKKHGEPVWDPNPWIHPVSGRGIERDATEARYAMWDGQRRESAAKARLEEAKRRLRDIRPQGLAGYTDKKSFLTLAIGAGLLGGAWYLMRS